MNLNAPHACQRHKVIFIFACDLQGVKPGQMMAVEGPSGTVNVVVPAGVGPGEAFAIQV